MTTLIAQLSDPHLRMEDPLTHEALEAAVARVLALRPAPAAVLVTGDIADSGSAEEYELAERLLSPLAMPVLLLAGNHDRFPLRTRFARMWRVPAVEGDAIKGTSVPFDLSHRDV